MACTMCRPQLQSQAGCYGTLLEPYTLCHVIMKRGCNIRGICSADCLYGAARCSSPCLVSCTMTWTVARQTRIDTRQLTLHSPVRSVNCCSRHFWHSDNRGCLNGFLSGMSRRFGRSPECIFLCGPGSRTNGKKHFPCQPLCGCPRNKWATQVAIYLYGHESILSLVEQHQVDPRTRRQ